MFTSERAVLIRYWRSGQPRRGSGLRVSGRYVLTADHCANGADHVLVVDGQKVPATVYFRSHDGDVDLAVLHAPLLPEVDPLPCAVVDRDVPDQLECQALGFPVWKGTRERPLLAQAGGYIPTAEGVDPQAAPGGVPLMSLRITDPEARGRPVRWGSLDEPGSRWAGMSGAVVVATGGLVVGVVRSHNLNEGGQSLTVTPLDAVQALPAAEAGRLWEGLQVRDPGQLARLPVPVEVNRPGSRAGSDSTEGWGHASTAEVPSQPLAQVVGPSDVVGELALIQHPASSVEDAKLVMGVAPVQPDEHPVSSGRLDRG